MPDARDEDGVIKNAIANDIAALAIAQNKFAMAVAYISAHPGETLEIAEAAQNARDSARRLPSIVNGNESFQPFYSASRSG